MSIEFDDPKNVDEMRQIAHEWILNRPTITHTSQSLAELVNSEVGELREAISEGKSLDEISLEVGDVFFSVLALDNGKTGKPDRVYSAVSRYCKICGFDLIHLFKDVHYKNRVNYPVTFFNEMSPFANPKDAISCLRVLRKAYGNPVALDQRWADLDREIMDAPFFDGWVAIGKFRSFVKKELENISESSRDGLKIDKTINGLLSRDRWNMRPLELANNQFNWSHW